MSTSYESYLFNFSASYSSGGLKRLLAYSKWFNKNGGARFIVSHRLKGIEEQYPANSYRFLRQTLLERAFNSTGRLERLIAMDGPVRVYFSYGVPLPRRIAPVMWYHLSNVLTVVHAREYVPARLHYKYRLLGFLTLRTLRNADVISAESRSSLRALAGVPARHVVSVNGSDDEIAAERDASLGADAPVDNVAVTVGTISYKMLNDVYRVFCRLRETNPGLRLEIIGAAELIPRRILRDPLVAARGTMPQPDVCRILRRARYYITTTLIENSYNAAAEGVFLARESFISDIEPHRELLSSVPVEVRNDFGTRIPVLHVQRNVLTTRNLKSWDQVVRDFIATAETELDAGGPRD